MEALKRTVQAIVPLDEPAMQAACRRHDSLTKPPGSLGRLEEIAIRMAGIARTERPNVRRKVIFTIAADHGVAAEGVSAYPQEVTAQMVRNFLAGGAAINVLARHAGAKVVVADFGVAADVPPHPDLVSHKIDFGTRNIAREPAMTREQAIRAVEAAISLVGEADLIGTGDMGIANTTAASAITAAVTRRPVEEVTGRGTGIDDAAWRRKVKVIDGALARHRPDPTDGLDILSKVGGFEIGGLSGVVLGAAARRIPVVLDGFISTSAGLLAAALAPGVKGYLFAAHKSVEQGHGVALGHLGLRPILDFDMRLGEGTGAALAMPIIEAACRTLCEMATFDEAGVSGRDGT